MPSPDAHRAPRRAQSVEGLAADLRAQLAEVLSRNGMGAFLWDLESDLIHVEPGGLAVLGLDPDEYDGRMADLQARILPQEIPAIHALITGALAERDDYGTYFRVRHPEDGFRWAHMQGSVHRDDVGRAVRVTGIIRDANPELQHLSQQAFLQAERGNQADIVQTVTTVLAQALTINDVITALTSDAVLGSIGAVASSFSLVEQDVLRRYGERGLPADFVRDRQFYRLDEYSPAPVVVRTRAPMFFNREDVRVRHPLFWPYIRNTDVTFIAVLPLVAQAEAVGAMAILYQDKEEFSPDERNLVLALASAVAQSVKRAMLYDQEHAMALGLQESMLPARIPDVPGVQIAVRYRPARTTHHIGGDWYDVVPLPTGRVGLVVGDVEGHDIHASAVMGQLRTALRAYATEGHPPAVVMARASAFLHDLDTDRFATCLYADYDPVSGGARFVRAGHHGPLVRRGDGSTCRLYPPGGLPLGLTRFDNVPYPTSAAVLHTADTLLLCTDGLLEMHDRDLETGMRRIEKILCDGPLDTDLLADHIVDILDAGPPQKDDVALLLVTRVGTTPR